MKGQAQLEINETGQIHTPEYITIQAVINRIIFHNPENGYCVLAVTVKEPNSEAGSGVLKSNLKNTGFADLLSTDLKLTGHLSSPRQGDEYHFTGKPTKHPRFGKQFNFSDAELILPVGKSGVARYLSQITRGVGIVKAEKIVAALGEDALEQIRENPAVLDVSRNPDLQFLTDEQKSEIVADLTKNSVQAELAALICGPGTGMGTVMRIMAEFGQDAVKEIKGNPYVLCDEVYGIGFKTADQIALRVGIKKNSPFRVEAALLFVLREAATEGHCYLRPNLIIERLIGLEGKKVGAALLAGSGVAVSDIAAANQRLIDDGRCVREGDFVYLKDLWRAEKTVAAKVRGLLGAAEATGAKDDDSLAEKLTALSAMLADIESRDSVEYGRSQKEAILQALVSPISIITGGPGTGKTTAINAIVDIYSRLHPANEIFLCAPTGRAAKRMSEAANRDASTIHRLLRYNPNINDFEYGASRPLPGPGLIIVDEASMIDIELAAVLLAAVEAGKNNEAHQIVLVGDIDQLPSVGPGSVLRDLIASTRVPTTRLQYNYRQAGGSRIAELAHRICQGEMISLKDQGDFEFVNADSGDAAGAAIQEIVKNHVVAQGVGQGNVGLLDFQVLLPMHRGSCGVKKLNEELREIVNPADSAADISRNKNAPSSLAGFRVGDKILVTKNNYHLDVFNGDLGIVKSIGKGSLTVDFGDNFTVTFPFEHLDILTLAYASTIHKAQGSEFELVIMGLCSQHYVMLMRNLLYTGLTRARRKLVLVGDARSVAMAIKNNKIEERLSRLGERVAGVMGCKK